MSVPIAAAPKLNVLALVGFIAAFVIPLVGLILGIVARRQLSAPGNRETGSGFARWAMVVGALGTVAQTVFFGIWISLVAQMLSAIPGS